MQADIDGNVLSRKHFLVVTEVIFVSCFERERTQQVRSIFDQNRQPNGFDRVNACTECMIIIGY